MKSGRNFEQYLAWVDCEACNLPFEFGGATQCGRLNDHNNNQDAIALWSRAEAIVGVVCDGCATSKTGFSNNEVGARLLSAAFADLVGRAVLQDGVGYVSERLDKLEVGICQCIAQAVESLVPDSRREVMLSSFFMTTILAFAIDRNDYAILGCGDGFYFLDGQAYSLGSEDGRYLSGRLLANDWRSRIESGDRAIKLHAKGRTNALSSLMLASDGLETIVDRFAGELKAFVDKPDKGQPGYSSFVAADFRRRVWQHADVVRWRDTEDAYDDRSFAIARRTNGPPPDALKTAPTLPEARES